MMNSNFNQIIAATDDERAGLFNTTAQRKGTTAQNIEKDFWVSWCLDVLFNGLINHHRMLFKGGTSLSKGFGLIDRFSEDIDITVYRADLGIDTSIEELKDYTSSKLKKTRKKIEENCENYITGELLTNCTEIITETVERNRLSTDQFQIVSDPEHKQTLKLYYPQAKIDQHDSYVERVVKLEFGAKSALCPNTKCTINPYIDDDMANLDFGVQNITTIIPERTLWDKIIILHSLKGWFDNKNELRGGGDRESRHYYDVFQLLQSETGRNALNDIDLGSECVLQSRVFFYRKQFNLEMAKPPTFSILPEGRMLSELRNDYEAMSGMIFGNPPRFEDIIDCIRDLEKELNTE